MLFPRPKPKLIGKGDHVVTDKLSALIYFSCDWLMRPHNGWFQPYRNLIGGTFLEVYPRFGFRLPYLQVVIILVYYQP
jgi:hypothetical protein